MTARIAVLASGSGTNLQALLTACDAPDFPADLVLVLSDRPNAHALTRARNRGVATEVVLKKDHPDRRSWDSEAVRILREHQVEWVCLAGFMRLISEAFLAAYPSRVLNIHPALLPAFPGLHAQRQTLEYGARVAGCTVHLVDSGTDTGPIIAQGVVPVIDGDDEETLKTRLLKMEHRLFPLALRWACEGRLHVQGRTVRVIPAPQEGTILFDPTP